MTTTTNRLRRGFRDRAWIRELSLAEVARWERTAYEASRYAPGPSNLTLALDRAAVVMGMRRVRHPESRPSAATVRDALREAVEVAS